MLSAFGTHAGPASWDLPYRKIRAGDYWVEDNASALLQPLPQQEPGRLPLVADVRAEHVGAAEDYRKQYEYAINTGFNFGQVRHRGAGIFFHVNGRGATAGCVSAPRWFLRTAMARLDPKRVPVIAIGR